jgi:tetratricopeptide (TPR) repeat protein
MSESLYEGYKDALRRGHVAAERGRLDLAVAAYREASRLAPDRALPHIALGGVLARLGRVDDALAAFRNALDRAPDDESALRGRADLLVAEHRPAEAAASLDRLAEVLERAGRLADACDVGRRALELAESRGRRRLVQSLVGRLRQAPEDPAAAQAIEHALGILEVDPGAPPEPPDPVPIVAPDPVRHRVAFEAAIDSGDLDQARKEAVAGAFAHRAAGQFNASIDACYEALAAAPADPAIHFALTQLYLDRGWRAMAADKLVLIGRLAEMTGDQATLARLCDLAARRFPDDARLAAMCLSGA